MIFEPNRGCMLMGSEHLVTWIQHITAPVRSSHLCPLVQEAALDDIIHLLSMVDRDFMRLKAK